MLNKCTFHFAFPTVLSPRTSTNTPALLHKHPPFPSPSPHPATSSSLPLHSLPGADISFAFLKVTTPWEREWEGGSDIVKDPGDEFRAGRGGVLFKSAMHHCQRVGACKTHSHKRSYVGATHTWWQTEVDPCSISSNVPRMSHTVSSILHTSSDQLCVWPA